MDADIPSTGLTVVVDPESADLDIVFVHGFKGHPQRTWAYKGNADDTESEPPTKVRRHGILPFSTSGKVVYWPRDLLRKSFPDARVLTYGYDTNIRHIAGKPICKNSVYDIAGDLLVELETQRRLAPERRLMFVAHSLGGIVVKEMLRRSSSFQHDRQAHLRQICDSTIGIMFFGTPHQGADPRRLLQKVAETAAKAIGFNVNQQIVDTLLPSSERLRELRDEFGPMAQLRGWTIHSFQESLGIRPLEGRKVVDDASSYINLPDVETTQHIGRDHMEMCRFTGPSDPEFTKVEAALRRMVDRHTTSQHTHSVTPSMANSNKENIINALRFDHVDFRRTAIKAAHRKTCKWLLKEPVYMEWLDLSKMSQHHGFLWIKGKPGTGKSTLMKFALTNAQRTRKDRISISFFFNARGGLLERSTQGMYRSLISQLLEHIPDAIDIIKALSKMSSTSGTQGSWSIEALKEVFEQIVLGLGRTSVICFIDALDECDEHEIRDMVSFFENLSDFVLESSTQFEVCLASRHYPHISIYRGRELILEANDGHDEDITAYIDSELKIGKSKLAEQVRTDLRDKAAGVFMWIVLVVDILNKEYDSGRIHKLRARLAELPSDLHGLFHDIMTRDNRNTQDLLHCIQWILFSSRPLGPQELYFALLTGESSKEFDDIPPDEITQDIQKRFILDTSKGLVEIVPAKKPKPSTVQFIHESVRDFFLKDNGMADLWPDLGNNLTGASHEHLRQSCEAYLNLDLASVPKWTLFDHGKVHSECWEAAQADPAIAFPFLQYATQNILWHANQAQQAGVDQRGFLATFPRERWTWLHNVFERHAVRQYFSDVTTLYIFAEKNLDSLISIHPDNLAYLGVERDRYRLPFVAAMANGSHRAIEKFMEFEIQNQPEASSLVKLYDLYRSRCGKHPKCSRDIQLPDSWNLKRKMWSSLPQHDGLLLAFLMLAKHVIKKNMYYLTMSKWYRPAEFSEAMVAAGLLLPETLGPAIYEQALILSLKLGSQALVRGILDPDNAWPLWDDSITSLYEPTITHDNGNAVPEAHRSISVRRNINLNARDRETGNSLLCLASSIGNEPVVRLLLATGQVEVLQLNKERKTCLHLAAEKGHSRVVEILLTSKNIIELSNIRDDHLRTPLHSACARGHVSVVKQLLLVPISNLDARDIFGKSVLHLAVDHGRCEVVKLLLDTHMVDVDLLMETSHHEWTALMLAVARADHAIARLLVTTGRARLDCRYPDRGYTPLQFARLRSDKDMVDFLLEGGAIE